MIRKYTFNGHVSMMDASYSGIAVGYGKNEDEAREDAKRNVAEKGMYPYSCVHIKELIKVE